MNKLLVITALACSMAVCSCSTKDNSEKTEAEQPQPTETIAPADNVSDTPQVLEFSALWCGPCRRFAPVFENCAEEYSGKILFTPIDIDLQPQLADKYGVNSVPTLVFLNKNGNEVDRIVGAPDEATFRKALDSLIK